MSTYCYSVTKADTTFKYFVSNDLFEVKTLHIFCYGFKQSILIETVIVIKAVLFVADCSL